MFPDAPRAVRGGWPRHARKLLLLLGLLCLPAVGHGQTAPRIPVGINLRPLTPYDRAWVFADAMKMAAPWQFLTEQRTHHIAKVGKNAGDRRPPNEVVLDGSGWPKPPRNVAVFTQVFTSMRGRFPAGQYTLTWKGGGSFQFRGAVQVVSTSPNRIVLDVDPWAGGAIELQLHGYDPTRPTTDIHLWLPGLENDCSAFHPLFMERLRPFSVLRFYPWMRVYSTSGSWSQRAALGSARQSTAEGVALEYMVELCNEVGSDPWFCIPHTADDQYVRNFATLVRDTLHPERRIYVEYSNEVWNTDFLAGQWARAQASKRGVPVGRVVAEETARVFNLWREVFGERSDRLVRVVGAHLHNPTFAQTVCQNLNGNFDAIAVGAYFSARADRDEVDAASTAEELMAAAVNNLEALVLPRITDHKNLANTYSTQLGRHIGLLTYEGGQSIVARSPGGGLGLPATLDVQYLPEMYAAYRRLIEEGANRGLELFVGYDFTGGRNDADTFSVLEYLEEPTASAPKYRAIVEGWENRNL